MKKIYTIMFFISLAVLALSIAAVAMYGLNFGVDFVGGSVLELEFNNERPAISDLEKVLSVTSPGRQILISPTNDKGIIIRTAELTEEEHQKVLETLRKAFGDINEKSFNSVGPTELKLFSLISPNAVLSVSTIF